MACLGGIMLVHGGENLEVKVTLDDFNLFDGRSETWLKVKMSKPDQIEFKPSCLFQNDFKRVKDSELLNERRGHKMCAVWDQRYYLFEYNESTQYDRSMWAVKRKLPYKEGFYIFGGLDERSVLHNDFWLVTPDYNNNKFVIAHDGEFMEGNENKVGMVLHKIEDFAGQAPCPRSGFQMTHLTSNQEQLIVIYGGRNDVIYLQTSNIAMNDVCVYNLNKNVWESLAIFG